MKKKTYMRHIWNLLDEVGEKVENIEKKVDLIDDKLNMFISTQSESNKDVFHIIHEMAEDSKLGRQDVVDVKSMISKFITDVEKETQKKAEAPAEEKKEEVNETPVKEEPEQKPEEKKAPAKKAPAKKSTKKTSVKK